MKSGRALLTAVIVTGLSAAPLFAQEPGGVDAKGYVTGLGGFATSVANTTGDVRAEAGFRVAPHVMAFGNLGRLGNLQADLQPTLDAATSQLATAQGLTVIGGGSLPATYFGGGVRVEIPTRGKVLPYALGGVSLARLSPSPQFTYSSGTLPDGTAPDVGTDVTMTLSSAGIFIPPPSSNAAMFTFGGGAQVLVAPRWAVDAGYRYSRIGVDQTLSTTALTTNGMSFGVSYRF